MPAQHFELIECGELSVGEWARLVGHDPAPFGEVTAQITWRPKDVNVGFRDERGRLVAIGGATVASIEVEGHGRFDVVGKGGMIVRPEVRGLGLSRRIIERVQEISRELGPDRAMCFCEPHLRAMYAGFGYEDLHDPVWVDQPSGRIVMPTLAMWQPIRPCEWPPGTIHVDGLPF
jgi:GNAT superfamily N-acetyltransferase